MEEWRKIEGFENYEVSNLGNIRNKKGQNKKKCLSNSNYLFIDLWKNNTRIHFYIHRLVALAFIDNPENKPEVDHKDRNRENNNVNNLRWVTSCENKINKDLKPNKSGEKYIKITAYGNYRIQIQRNKKIIIDKTFKTLDEAIKARNDFLENNN